MERSGPAWLWLFAGFLAFECLRSTPAPTTKPELGAEASARTLDEISPRELRRLPGIGQARAHAYAQLRWRLGAAPPLDSVHGIGPRIRARAEEALRAGIGWSPSRARALEPEDEVATFP